MRLGTPLPILLPSQDPIHPPLSLPTPCSCDTLPALSTVSRYSHQSSALQSPPWDENPNGEVFVGAGSQQLGDPQDCATACTEGGF